MSGDTVPSLIKHVGDIANVLFYCHNQGRKAGDRMWIEYLNNPVGRRVGDCAVRAVAKALDMGWESAYIALVINGIQMGDVMTANSVIGATLRQHGFKKFNIPNTCPDCYTIEEFAEDNPSGKFVVGTGSHVVAVENGSYFDAWDSGKETATYAWYKEGEK